MKWQRLEHLYQALLEVERVKSQLAAVDGHIGNIRNTIKRSGLSVALPDPICPQHEVLVDGARYMANLRGGTGVSVFLD